MKIVVLTHKNVVEVIKEAVKTLKEGKVVIAPTDTVYGIMGLAFDPKVVERIFVIKQRSLEKPVALFVRDIEMAKELAQIDSAQEDLLQTYWPGAVTFVLKAKQKLSPLIVKDDKIGLRIPDHPILQDILRQLNLPLAQSSANISCEPTPSSAKEIREIFARQKDKPDLIIDGGQLPLNQPSTVLDITVLPPKVLRG